MSQTDSKYILIVACAIFLCLGISTAAIGPLLPELAANAGVSLAAMGAVFTAIFLGSTITQLIAGPIYDRYGQRPVLLAGLIMITIGLGGLAFSRSQMLVLSLALLAGLGLGAVVLGNNLMIARVFAERSVSALNLLNFFFGLGAIIGPAAVGFSLSFFNTGLPVIGIDALAYFITIPFVLRIKPMPSEAAKNTSAGSSFNLVMRMPFVWLLGFMAFCYVGIETGLGGWISTYINQTAGLTLEISALVSSGFWLTFTIGRLVNAWLGMRLSPNQILGICLGGALSGGVIFSLSTGLYIPSVVALLLIGFSFGAIYPTVIAITSTAFQANSGMAVSVVSSLGSVGGMLIPLAMGYMIESQGPVSCTWATVLFVGLILILFLISRSSIRKMTQAPAGA
ncbi:MAG: MFS transporter [Anaerolineae bacterium]|nr:MFS transporter [Anaerolineae bacterium]